MGGLRLKVVGSVILAAVFLYGGCVQRDSATVRPGGIEGRSGSDQTVPTINAQAFRGLGLLAFTQNGTLQVLNGSQGSVRTIKTNGKPSSPRWSSSGRWLAFSVSTSDSTGGPSDSKGTLTLADIGSDKQIQVEQLSVTGQGDYSWAPAADQLLVRVAASQQEDELWLVKPSGEPTLLARPGVAITGFGWSPDGAAIAYTTLMTNGEGMTGDLCLLSLNGPEERVVYHARDNGLQLAAWWPDGDGVVFWEGPLTSASLRADGAQLKALRLDPAKSLSLGQSLLYPDWIDWTASSELLWVEGSGRENWTNKTIATADVRSGIRTEVQHPNGWVRLDPAFSRSSDMIAFIQAPERASGQIDVVPEGAWAESRELWVARKDGSGAKKLDAGGVASPMWSEDGSHILYLRDSHLYLVPATGGAPVLVTSHIGSSGQPERSSYYGHFSLQDVLDWHQSRQP